MLKTLINKTFSVLLTLILLTSFFTPFTASASETTLTSESEGLIYDFGSVPLDVKSKIYSGDELQYKNYFILRSNNSSTYKFLLIKESDIDYFYVRSAGDRYLSFSSTLNSVNYTYIIFNSDGSYNVVGSTYKSSSLVEGFGSSFAYGYSASSDKLQNYVDNIVYSSVDIKCDGMTIYYAKNNKAVTVKDLLNLPAGTGVGEIVGPQPIPSQPGDYDFIGPLPLIPIEGDPNFQGFKDWLIKNKKYEDLTQFGINCTANNISSIVDLWTGNYNSISGFFSSLKSAWSTISAVSQAKNIYNWFEQQWELYKKSLITYETIPIKDKDVFNYKDDYDEDGNFISSETAYLKLILGILNTFRNDVNNFSDTLSSYISSISININRLCNAASALPQTIANLTYNNFVEPINQILKAIDNVEVSSPLNDIFYDFYSKLLSLFIPDNDYMTSWTTDVTSMFNSKFGFLSQFAELKQTIDEYCFPSETLLSAKVSVDDGQLELEEYMNYPDFSLTAFETEHIKLNSKVKIIDWSTFDKYRLWFHRVVVAICYVIFITRRFKRSPNVVANNDISN